MQTAEIDVGRVVAGKYELVRLLGKGAMGEVWLAVHTSLGGEFAVKLVKPCDDEHDGTAAGRFQLEAHVSAKLSRKTRHVVSVSDHGEEDGLAYLVMELLEGESLEARIARSDAIALVEVVAIVMQVARALSQTHGEGIVHRDLKPANVFLTRDEDGRMLVKLLDFGIARSQKPFATRSPFATGKEMVLGTPSYMSPEQCRGLATLDYRCDVWGLAVVAYEALTREIPWEGETVEDIFLSICTHRMIPVLSRRPDLPPGIEGVFARAFAPKLESRFRSAVELSEALEALVDPAAVAAAMGGARPVSSPDLTSSATSGDAAPASRRANDPGADPVAVAIGDPTSLTPRRKKRGSVWLIAAIGAIAAITMVGLVGLALSPGDRATSRAAPGAPTASSAPATDRAPVTPANEPAAPATVVRDSVPSAVTSNRRPPVRRPPPGAQRGNRVAAPSASPPPAPAPPAPSPPPPVPSAAPAAPVVSVAPAPSPTVTARKPPDKGEVF